MEYLKNAHQSLYLATPAIVLVPETSTLEKKKHVCFHKKMLKPNLQYSELTDH